jgi:DNA-binding phage protein
MAIETAKWDVTEFLDSEETIFAYIEAALRMAILPSSRRPWARLRVLAA